MEAKWCLVACLFLLFASSPIVKVVNDGREPGQREEPAETRQACKCKCTNEHGERKKAVATEKSEQAGADQIPQNFGPPFRFGDRSAKCAEEQFVVVGPLSLATLFQPTDDFVSMVAWDNGTLSQKKVQYLANQLGSNEIFIIDKKVRAGTEGWEFCCDDNAYPRIVMETQSAFDQSALEINLELMCCEPLANALSSNCHSPTRVEKTQRRVQLGVSMTMNIDQIGGIGVIGDSSSFVGSGSSYVIGWDFPHIPIRGFLSQEIVYDIHGDIDSVRTTSNYDVTNVVIIPCALHR